MNQNIYLITTEFFENPELGSEFIKEDLKQKSGTEKLILVFDPLMIKYFSVLSLKNSNLLEKTIIDYYSVFEKQNKNQLLWYELDDQSNFYISLIGTLLLDLDYKTKEIHSIGMFPMSFKHGNVFLYFSISPYDIEDQYNLISFNSYNKQNNLIMSQLRKKGLFSNKEEKKKE